MSLSLGRPELHSRPQVANPAPNAPTILTLSRPSCLARAQGLGFRAASQRSACLLLLEL